MASSQLGNNNPYNQDNEISWLNWHDLEQHKEIYDFVKILIAYRKKHKILDSSFHGLEVYKTEEAPSGRELGVLLCGRYAPTCNDASDTVSDKSIYIALNMYWEKQCFDLPQLKKGAPKEAFWKVAFATCEEKVEVHVKQWQASYGRKESTDLKQQCIMVPPRTIVVLEG